MFKSSARLAQHFRQRTRASQIVPFHKFNRQSSHTWPLGILFPASAYILYKIHKQHTQPTTLENPPQTSSENVNIEILSLPASPIQIHAAFAAANSSNNVKPTLETRDEIMESKHPEAEIRIHMPWGTLAGKKWPRLKAASAPESPDHIDKRKPFICFHGWLDNSSTFDKIIPMIQKLHPDCEFLCFDAVGHGFSEPISDGVYVNAMMSTIYDIARVAKFLGLEESGFNSMGHSMGGNILTAYMCLFPEQVRSLLVFDVLGFHVLWENDIRQKMRKTINDSMRLEARTKPPSTFTYEQAKARLLKGSVGVPHTVNSEGADLLLKRGLKPCDPENTDRDCYIWSRDMKNLLWGMNAFPGDTKLELFRSYNATDTHTNYLHLMADDSIWYKMFLSIMRKQGKGRQQIDQWQQYLTEFDKNPNHTWKIIKGNHHFHLNSPDTAMEVIDKWLKQPAGSIKPDSSVDLLKAWGMDDEVDSTS